MASLFVLPRQDIGNGIQPEDGAKLFFFSAGTSTPKDTFTDEAASIPHTNPVIADSNGLFAEIFITGTYKVQLKDKNDVQIWESDPVREFLTSGDGSSIETFDTIAALKADSSPFDGKSNTIKEYTTGNRGKGDWTTVLSSTIPSPNNVSEVVYDSPFTQFTAVLQPDQHMDSAAYGMVDSVDAKAILTVAVNDPNVSHLTISQALPISGRVTIARDNLLILVNNLMKRVVVNPILLIDRAMFMADGQDKLTIIGDFDLQGEGTREIGTAGFELNVYTTTAGQTGISGPANSAIYFLRCTNSVVKGSAKNTGESTYIFRNCGSIYVDVDVENLSGSGVEVSTPASDESTNPMPVRGNWFIQLNGKFINDLKMGAGNAIGISFAGNAVNEIFRNVHTISSGDRVAREVHQEFSAGSVIEGFSHQVDSKDCLQGAVVTQGRLGTVTGTVKNGGTAGAGGLNIGYPDMYAYRGSTNSDNINVTLQQESTQDDGFTLGTDATMSINSDIVDSPTANYPVNIVGKYFGVLSANPSGAPLEATVKLRISATQLQLDLPARAAVSNVGFGFGSGLRNPLSFSGSGSINFDESNIKGGVNSGLPGEPSSSAVKFISGSKPSSGRNMIITAPDLIAGATADVGFEIGAGFGAPIAEYGNEISGFTENYKGFGNSTATRNPIFRRIVQDSFPDTAADTFGTPVVFTPRTQAFDFFYKMSIEFDFSGAPVGTLEAQIEAFFVDGGSNTVSLFGTADSTLELTTGQLATLHRDNQKMIKLEVKTKNSSAGRQADKSRLNLLGIES